MYVNYLKDGALSLGYLDGETLREVAGPPTDALIGGKFPLVPKTAPVVEGPVVFAPAILRPRSILCLMRSYRAHAEELGNEPPPAPNFFAKLPTCPGRSITRVSWRSSSGREGATFPSTRRWITCSRTAWRTT